MEISIELLRPVNPTGRSFITYVYGVVASKDREIIEKYKKELVKLVQKLGFKIEEKIGTDKFITGTVVISVDDVTKEPKKAYTQNLEVWNIEKEYNDVIEAEL